MSSAVNLFLYQCVMCDGIPFSVEMPRYNQSALNAMDEAGRICRDPSVKGYTNMEDLQKALPEDQVYEVKFTLYYKKSYKLMKKRDFDLSLLDAVVDTLRQSRQLDEKYRNHGLIGKFQGVRECHIKPDWLLVYLTEDDILTLTLVDTDSHADIFNM